MKVSVTVFILIAAVFCCFGQSKERLVVQTGHVNIFRGDVSPDGKTFVSGGFDGRVLKWNLQTAKHAIPLTEHKSIVTDILCAENNRNFYSCGYDARLIKWEYESDKPVKVLLSDDVICNRLERIPGSTDFAAICIDSTIRIFSEDLIEKKNLKIVEGWPLEIAYFKNDSLEGFAVACSDSSIKLFTVKDLRQFFNFKVKSLISEVRFNPSCTQMGVSTIDSIAYVLEFPSLTQMRAFKIPVQHNSSDGAYSYLATSVGAVNFFSDSLFICGTVDNTIATAETAPGSPEDPFIAPFKQNGFPIQILRIPGTSQLISIHSLIDFVIWELDAYYKEDRSLSMADIKRTVEAVSGISFHPSGKKLLVSTALTFEYSFEDGRTQLRGQYSGAFHTIGQYIKSDERIVYSMWDSPSKLSFNRQNKVFADTEVVFTGAINSFVVTPDDESIYVVHKGNRISVLSTRDYKIKKTVTLSSGEYTVHKIVSDRTGKFFALLCSDGAVRIMTFGLKIEKEIQAGEKPPLSVAFSDDGKRLVCATDESAVRILDIASRKSTATFYPTPYETSDVLIDATGSKIVTVSYDNVLRVFDAYTLKQTDSLDLACTFNRVVLSPDNKFLAAAMGDGTVGVYHFPSLKHVYSFVTLFNKADVIPYTNDNYFAGGKFTSRMLAFQKQGVVYPVEQYDLLYNRPDVVFSRCNYADTMLVTDYRNAYFKRLKKYNQTIESLASNTGIPSVKVTNRNAYSSITYDSIIRLNIHAGDWDRDLATLQVMVNNVPVFGVKGIKLKRSKTCDTTIRIPVQNGDNYIVIKSENDRGNQSFPEILRIKNIVKQSIKRNLYVVSIGVSEYSNSNYNLRYAAKDAADISKLFGQDSVIYSNTFTMVLTNKDVTKEKLADVKKFLSKARINDVVIVFMAGHGVLDKQLDFYFGTHDLDFNNPAARGISMAQIEEMLGSIRSFRKLLILDSCHSGEMVKEDVQPVAMVEAAKGGITFRGNTALTQSQRNQAASRLMNSLFTEISSGSGATVIASTAGADFAMESDEWKNGLFTYCFLKGLISFEADRDFNKRVNLDEMILYLRQKVSELSAGAQAPNTRYENEYCNFRLW